MLIQEVLVAENDIEMLEKGLVEGHSQPNSSLLPQEYGAKELYHTSANWAQRNGFKPYGHVGDVSEFTDDKTMLGVGRQENLAKQAMKFREIWVGENDDGVSVIMPPATDNPDSEEAKFLDDGFKKPYSVKQAITDGLKAGLDEAGGTRPINVSIKIYQSQPKFRIPFTNVRFGPVRKQCTLLQLSVDEDDKVSAKHIDSEGFWAREYSLEHIRQDLKGAVKEVGLKYDSMKTEYLGHKSYENNIDSSKYAHAYERKLIENYRDPIDESPASEFDSMNEDRRSYLDSLKGRFSELAKPENSVLKDSARVKGPSSSEIAKEADKMDAYVDYGRLGQVLDQEKRRANEQQGGIQSDKPSRGRGGALYVAEVENRAERGYGSQPLQEKTQRVSFADGVKQGEEGSDKLHSAEQEKLLESKVKVIDSINKRSFESRENYKNLDFDPKEKFKEAQDKVAKKRDDRKVVPVKKKEGGGGISL